MDLFSHKPVGWAMLLSSDSELTIKALEMAYESRGQPKGVIFYSDQGSHYTSHKFRQTLLQCHIKQSMSQRSNCCGNTPMERFFRSLKVEWALTLYVLRVREILQINDDCRVALGNAEYAHARMCCTS